MDLVLVAPVAAIQKVVVDVTFETAMGDREYAGTPQNGFCRELGWRGVAGSAAGRPDAGKYEQYGTCVEDFGAFGKGALDVLQ